MPVGIPKNTTIETIILMIIDICVTPISGVISENEAKLITDLLTSDPAIKAEPFFIGYTPENCIAFIDEDESRLISFKKSVIAVFVVYAAQDKLPFKIKMK